MSWLTEPFSLAFMQRAFMAFLGDALAHAILPGVAIAFMVGGNLMIGALIAAVVVAVGISYVSRTGAVRRPNFSGELIKASTRGIHSTVNA